MSQEKDAMWGTKSRYRRAGIALFRIFFRRT
jgi:hypothetical protein